ncbi:hypothetical protein RN001_012909 [Aquatica leii]|uniref:Uncharacterized protein n=1 Tax=Aquatica leii TaxID=1421715 RepID=A0AAN7PUX3_9COLE|nr:hypothetical protein RN001_012909 [Aquatica leii]
MLSISLFTSVAIMCKHGFKEKQIENRQLNFISFVSCDLCFISLQLCLMVNQLEKLEYLEQPTKIMQCEVNKGRKRCTLKREDAKRVSPSTMAESEISDRSKSCKRCNKVPQTTVECIVCNSCFHPSCAKYTKNIIFIDDKYVNCCDLTSNNGELEQVRNTSEVDIYKIELKYLHELLKQKDLVIKNQQIAIESLQNQILMINEYSKISKIHNNVDKDKDVRTFNVRDKNVTVSQHAVNKQNSSKGNNVKTNKNIDNQSCSLNTDASSNRKNTYSSVVMANDNSATVYANVNKPLNQEKKINDTLKTSKTSNLIVYGKNDAAEILGIQKNSFFFLTRVQPKNEVDDVIKFLTKNNINVVSCVNLPTKYNTYKSFKVGIASTDTEKIMSQDLWGNNILLKPFQKRTRSTF